MNTTSGIQDPLQQQNKILTAVNPFSNSIALKPLTDMQEVHLELINMNGSIVAGWDQITFHENELTRLTAPANLSDGIYLLRYSNGITSGSLRLVKLLSE
jgi:hypothetical protein